MTQPLPSISSAADRNKGPILDVLAELLPASGAALEIASGFGQHASWFTAALPGWTWQPSDADPQALAGLATLAASGDGRLRAPLRIDVLAPRWPEGGPAFDTPFDLVYCANMLHIAPWSCCAGLMQGVGRHLAAKGQLVLYGPFLERDVVTAPGNLSFDRSLRARDPAWGIRALDDVAREASQVGLRLRSRHAMPANNLLLEFARAAD